MFIKVDLHGLHVAEVEMCLAELIPHFQRLRAFSQLSIVTGSGHHSAGSHIGRARVLPAVIRLCSDLGLKYVDIKDTNGYVGGISVIISP